MNEQYKQVIRSGLRRERINIEMSDLEWAHRQRELAIVDAALNALDEPEWMPLPDGFFQSSITTGLYAVSVEGDFLKIHMMRMGEQHDAGLVVLPNNIRLCYFAPKGNE